MSCLFLFKSITYAQSGLARLKSNGITAYIMRIPSELAGGGCGYALKLKCDDAKRAKTVMAAAGVKYSSCYMKMQDGSFREMTL